MSSKTAIDWLIEQVNSDCTNSVFIKKELIDKAKEMEREQIEESYGDGLNAYRTEFCNRHEYYKKKYKNEQTNSGRLVSRRNA